MSMGKRKYRNMNSEELTQACEKFFDELCIINEEAHFLFHSTVLQVFLLFEHRRGSLTASKFRISYMSHLLNLSAGGMRKNNSM